MTRAARLYVLWQRDLQHLINDDSVTTRKYSESPLLLPVTSETSVINSRTAEVSSQCGMRQNAAARLVAGSRRSDHITPVLRPLHWLPVRRRIEFKLALLIHKSLNGSTPRYLSDDCQLVSDVGRRRLRSSDVSTCVVPRTHTGFGDRAFQVVGPRLWNSLPCRLHCVSPTRQ